jgi:peroxiredoxin family protein/TusA-related sulfurtransferase
MGSLAPSNIAPASSLAPVIDCRGQQCPAPILKLSEAARAHRSTGATLTVLATDADFPVDLEAWCRTTKSTLLRLEQEQDGVIRAQIRLAGGKSQAPTPTLPAASPHPYPVFHERPRAVSIATPAPVAAPAPVTAAIDLTGLPVVTAMRQVSAASVANPGQRGTFFFDAPSFEGRLAAWASATEAVLESIHREGDRAVAVVRFAGEQPGPARAQPVPADMRPAHTVAVITPPHAPLPALAPASPSDSMEPVSAEEATLPALVPRENRATLLVLHNDLEALLAALMVANASAAQGMHVEVYFAFWGIHLLRAESPRKDGPVEKPGLLQRMMLWMVPRGPSRQKLGKLHMGGIGTRILLRLMRKRNILALDKLIEAAAAQGVGFRVCSMSMGLMGLSQRDIVELPTLQFAGVTSFAEAAGRSAVSLVF